MTAFHFLKQAILSIACCSTLVQMVLASPAAEAAVDRSAACPAIEENTHAATWWQVESTDDGHVATLKNPMGAGSITVDLDMDGPSTPVLLGWEVELIAAELSGVHIDGMEDCLAKNTFQLNKIGPDVYGELSLAVVQRVDLDTVKIGSIEKIDPYLENYRVAFSVEAFDGEGMVKDNIVMSINSEINRARYGFANLIKSTDRMLLRSDCDLLVANDNESS